MFELHKKAGWDWALAWRLARLLREQRVDVVHSHNWPTFAYTVLATSLAGKPVVLHGEHGREITKSTWKRTLVNRWLARRVARVTTVCRALMWELINEWTVPPDRVTAVSNGVELSRFGGAHDPAPLRGTLELAPDRCSHLPPNPGLSSSAAPAPGTRYAVRAMVMRRRLPAFAPQSRSALL